MRKTLNILDNELARLQKIVSRFDRGENVVLANGSDVTRMHREELIVTLADLLEVRARITSKLSDMIDDEWKNSSDSQTPATDIPN